jgi:RNA polymerase sigma-70 factor, ECF subfamily
MTTSRADAAAFTRIFDRHRHAGHAYFLGRVADPELARDLLQETFLRAWRRLPEIAPLEGERQRAWIFTVARNLAIDSYRANAARRAAEAALRHDAATFQTTVAGPHRQAELGERLAQLDAAIRRLPEDQRVILSMASAGELTSRQIGEALGEPAGTVRIVAGESRRWPGPACASPTCRDPTRRRRAPRVRDRLPSRVRPTGRSGWWPGSGSARRLSP